MYYGTKTLFALHLSVWLDESYVIIRVNLKVDSYFLLEKYYLKYIINFFIFNFLLFRK